MLFCYAPRRQKDPLWGLSAEEHQDLERFSRGTSESAARLGQAKALLAISQGNSYRAVAQASGRRSGDAVSQLAKSFNHELRHGGGAKRQYAVFKANDPLDCSVFG